MEGSILILLGLVPYVGWVLGIIGVVLLLRGMKEFANYYQDSGIYQNSLAGVKYYIVALIALAVSGAGFIVGFVFSNFADPLILSTGNLIGLAVGITFLVVAFVFYVLAAVRLRKTFDTLAVKTGEHSFATAGTLLWVGSLLTILIVGLLLIFIAWIIPVVGFFAMKPPQQQQPYGYTPTPTQPPTGPTQAANYCSNCGTPVKPQGT
jgi:uncharacterized membrane protein